MEYTGEEQSNRLDVQEEAGGDAFQGDLDVDFDEGLDVHNGTSEDLLDFSEEVKRDIQGGRDGVELVCASGGSARGWPHK